MFNFDGQIVANAIINQQAAETFTGILHNRREARRAGGPTEQDYCDLLNAYNELVARFNGLIDEGKRVDALYNKTLAERDAQIVAQNDQIASDEAHILKLQRVCDQTAKNAYDVSCTLSDANERLKKAGLET
jgi:hypothetical protein